MSISIKIQQSVDNYTQLASSAERVDLLMKACQSGKTIDRHFVEDICQLELSNKEKSLLLSLYDGNSSLSGEDFLTRHWANWNQDNIIAGFHSWTERSDNLFWHRLCQYNRQTDVPQRVRYSIVNYAYLSGGIQVISSSADLANLEELSPAFHSLLLRRAAQWVVKHKALDKLATKVLDSITTPGAQEERAIPDALIYLAVTAPETIEKLAKNRDALNHWYDFVSLLAQSISSRDEDLLKFTKFLAKPPKKLSAAKLADAWPNIWQRQHLEATNIRAALELLVGFLETSEDFQGRPLTLMNVGMHYLSGIDHATLMKAILSVEDAAVFARVTKLAHGFIAFPFSDQLLQRLDELIKGNAVDVNTVMSCLCEDFRLRLAAMDSQSINRDYSKIEEERSTVTLGQETSRWNYFAAEVTTISEQAAARQRYFSIAYGGQVGLEALGKGYWAKLTEAYQKPATTDLDKLAELARKEPPVYQLPYIETLGRQQGNDKACLKLLDYVRATDNNLLRTTLSAFTRIGTPRAYQELVSSLTRPNIGFSLQLEICHWLQNANLTSVQDEIRSAISDLSSESSNLTTAERLELTESLSGLLDPTATQKSTTIKKSSAAPEGANRAALDKALEAKVPNFSTLSSEVKRALRTAQFFHDQVSTSEAEQSIDLSPVIDMQYKALELTFRERFENACGVIINKGIIQRKLDIIGYARPIPKKMDEFENYAANLPVINTVPYFSKFKMRKMLRALCQYRRGKRFTLDGLKAFGIFFLVFSRKKCHHGLENLFPLPFSTDEELYNFVKTLHIFQDFRNRAAHEGFQPSAKNDIDGIWEMTGQITTEVKKIYEFLEATEKYWNDHQRAS